MLALCAIFAFTALSSGTSVATTSKEHHLHAMVNSARSSSGLGGLRLSGSLSRRAHRHSARMAESGRLFHSCLSCRRGGRSSALAENVGVGDTLRAVHRALMRSSSHRRNILSKAYDRIGVGIVRRGGRIWITQLFA